MISRRPTIIDIANECGLSKSTVSLAFQEQSNIADTTRTIVLEAAKKIGYLPNQSARSLRTASSKMIGIIIQDSLNPYYSDLVRQIEQELKKHGYDIIVAETEQDLTNERRALERMQERQVDGVIICPMDYEGVSELLEHYEAAGIHCVVLGAPARDIPFDAIEVDLRPATDTAMDYLVELGHKNIAFVCGAPAWQNVSGRLSSFKAKLKQHGLPMQENSIYRCGFTLKDGYEAGKHLLSMHPRPTAIFAVNDLLAIGVMRAATDLNLNVPGDVSVVGVDNIELSAYTNPTLTTIAQPIQQLAGTLSELMISSLGTKEKPRPRRIRLEASFLTRESTASPKSTNDSPANQVSTLMAMRT